MQTAEIIALATEHFLDAEAFAAFLEYEDIEIDEAVQAFEDAYGGTYDNLAAWAEDLAEGTGMLDSMPRNLRCYFDFEAYGRDCELDGSVWTAEVPGGIAIFWQR